MSPRREPKPTILVKYADLKRYREAGEEWPSICARYGGASYSRLRTIWNEQTDAEIRPRRKRGAAAAAAKPPRRSPAPSTALSLSHVNKALAIDTPARPESNAVNHLVALMVKNGISKIVVDLDRGTYSVTSTESFPVAP